MKRGDRWVVLVLGLVVLPSLVLPLFVRGDEAGYASITRDGKLIERVDLRGSALPRRIEILGENGACNVIQVEPGRVRMLESNCPEGLCVMMGWLEKPGDTAVCLPHRLMITVEGEGELDAISR